MPGKRREGIKSNYRRMCGDDERNEYNVYHLTVCSRSVPKYPRGDIMGFSCGFLGLPNAGKSTLFNALSAAGADVEGYPFCTTEAQIGTVEVPDTKLDDLLELYPEKEKVNTKIEFYDLAGLVEGAHHGEGLGNQFLAEIRGVDALIHVVRCFNNPDVPVEGGELNPYRDIETVRTELLLKDLETIENRLKKMDDDEKNLREFYAELRNDLEEGIPIRDHDFSDGELKELRGISPLTAKPVLYVANVSEESSNECVEAVNDSAETNDAAALVINSEIEAEVRELGLNREEQRDYLAEWGLEESALDRLIREGYNLLNLITYYTTDGPEVRAWTVPRGADAETAAGRVHSDFAEGFVHAEVVGIDDLLEMGGVKEAREQGLLKTRGEDYEVQNGDVIHFVTSH